MSHYTEWVRDHPSGRPEHEELAHCIMCGNLLSMIERDKPVNIAVPEIGYSKVCRACSPKKDLWLSEKIAEWKARKKK